MEKLIEKLNLKDFQRICVLNPEADVISSIQSVRPQIRIDQKIDPRYLYNFFMIFVTSRTEVDDLSHRAIHNLYEDGILWFVYPRNIKDIEPALSRDKGWDMLKSLGFKAVRQIIVNEEWIAIRFRNARFVRSRMIMQEG
jgi:hypothetical protein